MISNEDFKKSLGPLAEKLTDGEIEKIKDNQYKLADVLFNMWAKKETLYQNKTES